MPAWNDFDKPHTELVNDRRREEPKWRDLQRLLDEDGENLDAAGKTSDETDTFDSTGLYAKDDFIGGLFTDGMNPAERWFEFGLEDTDLAKWGPVKKWLWDFQNIVFGSLDPAVSRFYIMASPWLGDLAMVGNGFLWQEEQVGRNALIERALPFREMYRGVDAAGKTSRLHREFMLKAPQVKGMFGDRAPAMHDSEEAKFVHVLHENEGFVPGALGPRGKPWTSCYVSPDKRDFYCDTPGFFELPIHEIMWEPRARAWAKGPGHKALPDLRGLDEKTRAGLVALQFMAEPMLLVHDESVMSAADISPSNLIYGGMNPNGKALVEHLSRGENMQYPLADIERTRSAIREAFYFSMFQLVNRPQMTATEFSGWKEEKLRVLARHLVCVQDGLGGFVARRAGIFQRAGKVPPAPPELENQRVKLKFTSPFSQVQKMTRARNAISYGQSLIALQPLQPDVGDVANVDNIARAIGDGLSGDPDFIRDPREVAALRQGRAQQQQQDQQINRAAGVASVVADFAHAQQAQTLSKGRVQGT